LRTSAPRIDERDRPPSRRADVPEDERAADAVRISRAFFKRRIDGRVKVARNEKVADDPMKTPPFRAGFSSAKKIETYPDKRENFRQ
jgi:hypothetical protein